MTFAKIMCPTDFSPGAQQAMRTAVRLATEHDAELVLVHAWYIPPPVFAGDYVAGADFIQQNRDDAERELESAAADARAQGARRVTARLLKGLPWQQIVEAAEHESNLGLVVIGTYGRTGLARVLMGSVAEQVVRHASCAVLTVRPSSEPAPYRHVLCPVDFSKPAHQAMRLAVDLTQAGSAGITLLHVLELPVSYTGKLTPEFHRDLDARAAAALDRWMSELKAQVNVPVTRVCRIGSPGAQILALVEEDRSLDLVVMGSRGRTGIARMVLGSVAEKIVRHARCPVVVAHGPRGGAA